MWKKLEDSAGPQPEFDSKPMPESTSQADGEALIKAYRDHLAEKGRAAVDQPKVFTEGQDQPSHPATLEIYTEAVSEFTRNASAFIEQIRLLTKARDSYKHAMNASAELRKILDSGDESLRTLMAQLEQAVNIHVEKAASDRKRPEPMRVEAIRGGNDKKTLP